MQLTVRLKRRVLRLLGRSVPAHPAVSRAAEGAFEGFSSGLSLVNRPLAVIPIDDCNGDPFDSRPCMLACCPSTKGLASEDPDAFNGAQKGGEGPC